MKRRILHIALLFLLGGCSAQNRLHQIREDGLGAQLSLSEEQEVPELEIGTRAGGDTLVVNDPEGNRMIIMKAVKDENGEMVATDVLEAARVTARFRNIAERMGNVDLRFQVLVPARMQDSRWQIRLFPTLTVLDEESGLDPVLITGNAYRDAQLKGYGRYQRYLESIAADSAKFVNRGQLETFLKRNDTAGPSLGVPREEALEHYTNQFRVRRNRRKIERKDERFARWVKVPIVTEGLRLDTVIRSGNGDFQYDYVQRIGVRPGLRKAVITLSGGIYDEDREVYRIPESEPLTFYISSLSGLADETVRYRRLADTAVVDTVYMEGVRALRDHAYKEALTLLKPYRDFNAAVACTALEYNASALDILDGLPETDKVLYLKAVLYSRREEDARAVECYLKACRMNPALVHRGNLDPEISSLIRKYDIYAKHAED